MASAVSAISRRAGLSFGFFMAWAEKNRPGARLELASSAQAMRRRATATAPSGLPKSFPLDEPGDWSWRNTERAVGGGDGIAPEGGGIVAEVDDGAVN